MAFRTRLTSEAKSDVREAVAHIQKESKVAARRWQIGLRREIASLKDHPESYGLIPEAESLGQPYRAIHYFSHRIIYRVDAQTDTVLIVRVYHGSRRSLPGGEIE